MTHTKAVRLLVVTIVSGLAAAVSRGAVPVSHKTVAQPRAELASAAEIALDRGYHGQLPPHISTLLGLTHEQQCEVMQGILRSTAEVQGIEVSEKNHNDVVIFVVDLTTKDQTFYLTSPTGSLRRVVSVKQGIGREVQPSTADRDAFQKQKEMWEARLAPHASAK